MSTVVQTTYRPQLAPGVVGLVAQEEQYNINTRICETAAGIGFGLAVSQGTASDKGALLGGSAFIGITVRDVTLDRIPINPLSSTEFAADTYPQYGNMGVLDFGVIWVMANNDVSAGDPLYYDTTTGLLGNSASGESATGSITFAEQPTAGQTVTMNGVVATFVANGTALTDQTSAATATTSAVLTFAAVPSFVVAGMPAYDVTTSVKLGTISSVTATTVTLAADVPSAVGVGDTISFGGVSLGQTLGDTIDNLADVLTDSIDAAVSALKYAAYPPSPGGAGEGSGANTLQIADKTVGTGGNAIAFSTNASGATVSGTTLSGGTSSATAVTNGYWRTSALAGNIAKVALNLK